MPFVRSIYESYTGEYIQAMLVEMVTDLNTNLTIDTIKKEYLTIDHGSNFQRALQLMR